MKFLKLVVWPNHIFICSFEFQSICIKIESIKYRPQNLKISSTSFNVMVIFMLMSEVSIFNACTVFPSYMWSSDINQKPCMIQVICILFIFKNSFYSIIHKVSQKLSGFHKIKKLSTKVKFFTQNLKKLRVRNFKVWNDSYFPITAQ